MITCDPHGTVLSFLVYGSILPQVDDSPSSLPVDLSAATCPNGAELWSGSLNMRWTAAAPQAITSNHTGIQWVSIRVTHEYDTFCTGVDIKQRIGEIIYGHWLDIDQFLIQFWEPRWGRSNVHLLSHIAEWKGESDRFCVVFFARGDEEWSY